MKILIVKLSSMGDVLHAMPAVEEIARTGAEVHWAVQPEFAELVRAFSSATYVIEVPRPSKFVKWLKALREVRREKYDAVVDLQGLLKSAVVARIAKTKKRFGPAYAREGAGCFYDAKPEKEGRKHAVEENMDVANLVIGSARRPVVPETGSARRPVVPKLHDGTSCATKRVAIAPKSRWDSKNWPANYFNELIRLLAEKNVEVCIIGGKGDDDQLQITNYESRITNYCGKLSLLESAAIIKTCDVLITNDSGPMHIAAALGVRCVAMFGPTDASRTGPYGEGHVVLRGGDCELAPCYKRVCPKGTKACMAAITPEEVVKAVLL